MRPRLWSLMAAVVLLTAAVAWGEVTIDGPDKAIANIPFDLAVEGMQMTYDSLQKEPPQIEWKLLPESAGTYRTHLELKAVPDEKTKKLVWVVSPYATFTLTDPGKAGVVLMVVAKGVGTLLVHEVTVAPFPGPDPDPDPDPAPDQDLWGAVLVEETGPQRDPILARLLADPAVDSFLEENGLVMRVTDRDAKTEEGTVPTDLAPYLEMVKKGDLPTLVIVGDRGKIFYNGDVPETSQKLFTLLRKYMEATKP